MNHSNRWNTQKRSLIAASITHALHDGYTDALYAFMPVWQAQFELSYAALAVIRALYYATMGGLQLPADWLLRGWSARAALILSTAIAATGLVIMALPFELPGLCVGLIVAGVGSSIQHPRASLLVTDSYGEAARRPLGIYNFAGDLGKAVVPALVALLLTVMAWRPVLGLMAMLGIALICTLVRLVPPVSAVKDRGRETTITRRRGGFRILTVIGGFDTATRMGYLLFLPFLVQGQGGGLPMVGVALALLFIGGAFGKR
ncbi:MFS transporter [Brucella intermedia]|uniref:MFS transporter n=1 Tax=Brucella intermedia TaxID=94625 RepID=UPI0022496E35|nr:MFS transporter [Brucella intermedia]